MVVRLHPVKTELPVWMKTETTGASAFWDMKGSSARLTLIIVWGPTAQEPTGFAGMASTPTPVPVNQGTQVRSKQLQLPK